MPDATDAVLLERIFREERGRVVATLIRRFGDIDLPGFRFVDGVTGTSTVSKGLDTATFTVWWGRCRLADARRRRRGWVDGW